MNKFALHGINILKTTPGDGGGGGGGAQIIYRIDMPFVKHFER